MEGGVRSQTEAAARLGISRHALDRRRIEGKLLALPLGAKDYRYPVWQFGLAGIEKMFAALGDRDPWEQISFFLNPNGLLDDSTPLQMLKESSENLPPSLLPQRAMASRAAERILSDGLKHFAATRSNQMVFTIVHGMIPQGLRARSSTVARQWSKLLNSAARGPNNRHCWPRFWTTRDSEQTSNSGYRAGLALR